MKTMKNTVSLMGYLGSDIQFHTTKSGRKVAHVRLATNEYYKDKAGERAERTDWHNIKGWGPIAERMERLKLGKGSQVFIEGKLTHRTYEDKDGVKRYVSEVVIAEIVATSKAKAAKADATAA